MGEQGSRTSKPAERRAATGPERLLMYAAVFYAAAFVIHTGDHLRRGLDVETVEVVILGSGASVLQVIAIAMVLTRHRLAPLLAVIVGFPDAVGIAAVHLLPHWSALSDSFPDAHGTGVNAFSWVAAITEVAGALAFGLAGLYVLRHNESPPADQARSRSTPRAMTAG